MGVPVIMGIKSLGTTLTVVRPIIWMVCFHVNSQVSFSLSFKVTESAVRIAVHLPALLCYGRLDVHITDHLLWREWTSPKGSHRICALLQYINVTEAA